VLGAVVSAEALNLEAIDKALHQHALKCPADVVEIHMVSFEVERLGWEDYKGIPIVSDPEMGTGRFRLVCEREHQPAPQVTEAVGVEA
jgi:hypothetical protein